MLLTKKFSKMYLFKKICLVIGIQLSLICLLRLMWKPTWLNKVFRRFVEVGFVPSVVACNFHLNGLVKLRCVDQCWEVYEEIGRIGIHPNAYTFNMLINVWWMVFVNKGRFGSFFIEWFTEGYIQTLCKMHIHLICWLMFDEWSL